MNLTQAQLEGRVPLTWKEYARRWGKHTVIMLLLGGWLYELRKYFHQPDILIWVLSDSFILLCYAVYHLWILSQLAKRNLVGRYQALKFLESPRFSDLNYVPIWINGGGISYRVGGWFRSKGTVYDSRINHPSKHWKVVRSWHGVDDLVVADQDNKRLQLPTDLLVGVLSNFNSFEDMVRAAIVGSETSRELEKVQAQRQKLGKELVAVLYFLRSCHGVMNSPLGGPVQAMLHQALTQGFTVDEQMRLAKNASAQFDLLQQDLPEKTQRRVSALMEKKRLKEDARNGAESTGQSVVTDPIPRL